MSFLIFLIAWEYPLKKVYVNFLINPQEGKSTLISANVKVYMWLGGKYACVNLIGISPLVRLKTVTFIVGQAKHEKTCSHNQHALILFMFDTFDFLVPEAANHLQKVQKVICITILWLLSLLMLFCRKLI
jgi:hypothetical protein